MFSTVLRSKRRVRYFTKRRDQNGVHWILLAYLQWSYPSLPSTMKWDHSGNRAHGDVTGLLVPFVSLFNDWWLLILNIRAGVWVLFFLIQICHFDRGRIVYIIQQLLVPCLGVCLSWALCVRSQLEGELFPGTSTPRRLGMLAFFTRARNTSSFNLIISCIPTSFSCQRLYCSLCLTDLRFSIVGLGTVLHVHREHLWSYTLKMGWKIGELSPSFHGQRKMTWVKLDGSSQIILPVSGTMENGSFLSYSQCCAVMTYNGTPNIHCSLRDAILLSLLRMCGWVSDLPPINGYCQLQESELGEEDGWRDPWTSQRTSSKATNIDPNTWFSVGCSSVGCFWNLKRGKHIHKWDQMSGESHRCICCDNVHG